MNKLSSSNKSVIVGFTAAILVIALLVIANTLFLEQVNAGTDFLVRWLPMKLLLKGDITSPYSKEATIAIQMALYGRLAKTEELQGLFLYPYYMLLFLLPFGIFQNFSTARILWMTMNEIIIILIVISTIQHLKTAPKPRTVLLWILFFLISPRFFHILVDGNPSILCGFFLLSAIYLLKKDRDVFAGICLACSTIKPQMVIIFIIVIELWAFFEKRYRFILSSLGSMIVLIGGSFIFYPNWLSEFINQLISYPSLANPNSPSTFFSGLIPSYVGTLFNILIVGLLIFEWSRIKKTDNYSICWTLFLTLNLVPFSSLPTGNRYLVVLIPAYIISLSLFSEQVGKPWLVDIFTALLLIIQSIIFYSTNINFFIDVSNPILFNLLTIGLLYASRKRWKDLNPEINKLGENKLGRDRFLL